MRNQLPMAVLVALGVSASLQGKGDGSFQSPLAVPAGRPGPVSVHAGDLNKDGKLELILANGSASM